MEKSLEDTLYQSIVLKDQDAVSNILQQGANPNKITGNGKTCLGEASNIGTLTIVKLLVDTLKTNNINPKILTVTKKRHVKSHKRKLRNSQHDETIVKCKNLSDRNLRSNQNEKEHSHVKTTSENQGYFVFIHSEGSSSDESKISSLKSPMNPPSLVTTPLADLEWDEDIGNFAPTTSEDETWTSMYKWYAAILECTGAAIASASVVSNGIDQQDAFMRTALHYAVEQGHTGIVKLLIDSGCKIDIAAGDGLTPLHIAVVRNHVDIVEYLLSMGSQVNYKTHEKMTPLHFAASRGLLDLVNILVGKGADLEARDTNERTALYLAAGRGHVNVVQYLISVGANVNGEEIHGYTPLCEAVWQRYKDVVELLLRSRARVTHSHKLLHNAIIQRQEDIISMLSTLGGGINLHDDNGDTPLLLATRLSLSNIVKILLEKGANVNSCNSITGANVMHIAVENIQNPIVFEELLISLLEYNIDLNAIALTGDTALNRALLLQKDQAAVLLVRHGADVNSCDLHSCGLDNLSIASRRKSSHLANLLLKAGHHVPAQDTVTVPNPETTLYWLQNVCKEPLNLFDLSRIKIRSICKSRQLFSFIDALPLPKSLKRLLMLEEEGCGHVSCIVK